MTTTDPTDNIYWFSVRVPYAQCEALYQSGQTSVVLTDDNGTRVQLPASALRRYITTTGIAGRFRLIIDKNKKIRSFERVA